MTTFNISLSEDLKEKVKTHAARGGHASVEDYLETLIREGLDRELSPEMEAQILEGLDSPAEEMPDAEWDQMKSDLIRRFGVKVSPIPAKTRQA